MPDGILFGRCGEGRRPTDSARNGNATVSASRSSNRSGGIGRLIAVQAGAARKPRPRHRCFAICAASKISRPVSSAGASSPTAAAGASTIRAHALSRSNFSRWTCGGPCRSWPQRRACSRLRTGTQHGLGCSRLSSVGKLFYRRQATAGPSISVRLRKEILRRARCRKPVESGFRQVFPELAQRHRHGRSGRPLQEVREAALILLYRLLFILYAEDRDFCRYVTVAMTTTVARSRAW